MFMLVRIILRFAVAREKRYHYNLFYQKGRAKESTRKKIVCVCGGGGSHVNDDS